jgi:hypothetical protein
MNHPYNRVQLYADNTAIKYPLDDLSTSGAPDDILVDLAITAPSAGGTVHLTNLIVTASYAFVSLELYSGGLYSALAHVLVRRPTAWKIYPLTAIDGCHGWLVFGPGVKRPYSLIRTPTAIDPRCVLHAPAAAKT